MTKPGHWCCVPSSASFLLLLTLAFVPAAVAQQADIPSRLTFSAARDLMLAHSPALLRDEQNLTIARTNVGQARLRINPELEISSESYPLFESRPGSFLNNQELITRATQTFETAGKRGKRTLVAENELSATGSDVRTAFAS